MKNTIFALFTIFFISIYAGCSLFIPEEDLGNDNTNLESLSVSEGTLTPSFDPGVTVYSIDVGFWTESITVTGTADDESAIVSLNSGVELPLIPGDNTVEITVTAENRNKDKSYLITIRRAEASPFITKWKTDNYGITDNTQIRLPFLSDGKYDCIVDWGDETSDHITKFDDPALLHTYNSSGTYTVTISGKVIGFSFKGFAIEIGKDNYYHRGDSSKMIGILNWGSMKLGNSGFYFNGCTDLVISAEDSPNLEGVTNMQSMFGSCNNLTEIPGIEDWDLSQVTIMTNMFTRLDYFNQDLRGLDVSNVSDMSWMFYKAIAFNQDISEWDVSNVTNMEGMFAFAESFNQDIGDWTVSNVTNMSQMFNSADQFDQDLGGWDVSKITDMSIMFGWDGELSTLNFDALLIGWSSLPSLQSNIQFGAGNSQYSSAADAARQSLIETYNWTISDGGLAP